MSTTHYYWIALCRLLRHPFFVSLLTLLIGTLITSWNVYNLRAITFQLHKSLSEERDTDKSLAYTGQKHCLKMENSFSTEINEPLVWINGKSKDHGYLKHVRHIFELLGYKIHLTSGGKPAPQFFNVLWNHEFPFTDPQIRSEIVARDGFRLVNHIPGSGYYTSKVQLAALNIDGIPPAFPLPQRVVEFQRYAKEHPDLLWVQKSNAHRGIRVLPVEDIDFYANNTFIQQFIQNPLLIDGRKFDIGIYTIVTSLSPLRVYIYDADILLRFCAANHEPFDAKNIDSYVVGDNYTPMWEMPSFAGLYHQSGLSFKQAFDILIQRKFNIDAEISIHAKIRRIIRQVFEVQNKKMQESLKNFRLKDIFFELSRFDFVVDDQFNVFLMEANMSPNLSSGHFVNNRFLYESLLFDILSLVGIGQRFSTLNREHTEFGMTVPERQLAIYSTECENKACSCDSATKSIGNISEQKCVFCSNCLTNDWRRILRQTYNEHLNKRGMRRVVPPTREDAGNNEHNRNISMMQNDLLAYWLAAQCSRNMAFC